jgi:uncharacterized membrane protein HdeD (DUF308 family)
MLMDPSGEIVNALILAGVFLMILGLGELIYHFWPARPELSRKSVHFLSGLTALSFPYLIQSAWLVLLLALGFSSLIFLSRKKGILRSLNDVSRSSSLCPSSSWPFLIPWPHSSAKFMAT